MCGRYYFDFEEAYHKLSKMDIDCSKLSFDISKEEIFPTQNVLVLLKEKDKIIPAIKKWGILGYQGNLLINARNETIKEKPTFSKLLDQRCIIIASGFYEWKKQGTKKAKIYIKKENAPILYMAGIYNEKNEFVIITVQSKGDMARVHERSPLLLDERAMKHYLFHESYAIDESKLLFTLMP
ncbi:MAG: SOS response-associated peptidase family protein [Erysipelotrichaceae bacterium]